MSVLRSPVVVTGAAGNLGSRLVPWLETAGREVRPVDRRPLDHPRAALVDLTEPGDWTEWMAGAQAVIHLAGVPGPMAPWSSVEGPNVFGTRNVVRAAKLHGVERLVFSSSVWAVREKWETGGVMTAGLAQPGRVAYGRSKAIAEALIANAASEPLSCVILRVGGRNASDARPTHINPWEDSCWLGWNDFLRGIDCAVDAEVEGLVTANLVSDNPAKRWSQVEAREQLGFVAQEHFTPIRSSGLLQKVRRRLRRVFL